MEEPEEGDAVQPDGPMAEELAAEVLVSIIDALGLEEVGDPYLTLRAGAHRIGAVRVWQPPSLNRMPASVEKVVYMHLRTSIISAQWIFAFSAAQSLVPHFSARSLRRTPACTTRPKAVPELA